MKITITIPDSVYEKLEVDRGMIPRSTWIQTLVMGYRRTATEASIKAEPLVVSRELAEDLSKGAEKALDKLVKSGVVKKGVKELPSQSVGEFKTYFK